MVVFTCNNCGDSLQKPKVEKHYLTGCRGGKNLTCVDCLKDFRGDEYVTHTKCLTEEQRYSAKGSMPNGDVKKGEIKQQTWTDMIGSIIEKEKNLELPFQQMLKFISGYVNIPRKKQKFINFVTNSFGYNYNKAHVEIIWDLIEKHKAEQYSLKKIEAKKADATNGTEAKETNGSKEATKRKADGTETQETDGEVPTKKKKSKKNSLKVDNGENTDTGNQERTEKQESDGEVKAKKKKSKKSSTNGETTDTNNHENGINGKAEKDIETQDADDKFSYEDKILELLTAKKQMSLKKLQKKVLNAYIKHQGIENHTDKHVKKFTKHLKKIPNIELTDDLVTLT